MLCSAKQTFLKNFFKKPGHRDNSGLPITLCQLTASASPLQLEHLITINQSQWSPFQLCLISSVSAMGVTISSDLIWSSHINNTCNKARKQLGFLYQNFYQADCKNIAYLYKSTIVPLLDYCCCVWDLYHTTYIAKLAKVQKFRAKLSTGLWSQSYDYHLSQVKWPTWSSRRKFQNAPPVQNTFWELHHFPRCIHFASFPWTSSLSWVSIIQTTYLHSGSSRLIISMCSPSMELSTATNCIGCIHICADTEQPWHARLSNHTVVGLD